MARYFVVMILVILPCVLAGCDSMAEDLILEQIEIKNALSEAMESAKPDAEVVKIEKRLEVNKAELQQLNLSDDAINDLISKHSIAISRAHVRLTTAKVKRNIRKINSGLTKDDISKLVPFKEDPSKEVITERLKEGVNELPQSDFPANSDLPKN